MKSSTKGEHNAETGLPPPLVAKIMSFIVEDYWKLAEMRSWSKVFRDEIVPGIIRREHIFLRCCRKERIGKHFLDEVINHMPRDSCAYEDASQVGEKWIFHTDYARADRVLRERDKFYDLFEGCRVLDLVVFEKVEAKEYFDTLDSFVQEDESALEWNEVIATKVHEAKTYQELMDLFPFDDYTEKVLKVTYPYRVPNGQFMEEMTEEEADKLADQYRFHDGEHFRAVLTLVVPKSAPCVNQSTWPNEKTGTGDNPRSTILLRSTPHRAKRDDDEDISKWENDPYHKCIWPLREFVNSEFVGHVVQNGKSSDWKIVRVAMELVMNADRRLESWLHHEWFDGYSMDSLALNEIQRKHQSQCIQEGVAIVDGAFISSFKNDLNSQLDALRRKRIKIDPFCHVAIVKDYTELDGFPTAAFAPPVRLTDDAEEGRTKSGNDLYERHNRYRSQRDRDRTRNATLNFWGRIYDSYKYQVIPTYVHVDSNGNCKFQCNIQSNLQRTEFPELYHQLELLLAGALPMMESVYGFCREVRRHVRSEYRTEPVDDYDPPPPDPIQQEHQVSLRNQHLQVITKVLEMTGEFQYADEQYWNVVGVPKEEIVATAVFILRENSHESGETSAIQFKRAYYKFEARYVEGHLGGAQGRPVLRDYLLHSAILPLGEVLLKPNRCIVFPNCHITKLRIPQVEQMSDDEEDEDDPSAPKSKRQRVEPPESTTRLVYFHLVNPEKRVLSTRERQRAQAHSHTVGDVNPDTTEPSGSVLDLEHEARRERRSHLLKDWNVREMELYTD